jgi:iron complex outermembrane receptor protein
MLGFPYNHHDSPRNRTYRPVDLELSTSDFEGHGLTLTWDVSSNFQIKSLTGYRELSWVANQEYVESFTSDPGPLPSTGPVSTASYDVVHDHQFSQELQFIGNLFNERVEYVAGLYYFEEGASHFERYTIQVPNFGLTTLKDRWVSADSKSKAVYAQATWTPPILNDRLGITLGGRYTEDDRAARRRFIIDDTFQGILVEDPATASNKDDFSKFNPALTVNYDWTDDVSTYVKVVTGYKAGGSSESGAFGSFNQTFTPEEVTTYELGLKSYWLDRRVRINAALFQSEFEDMQLAFNSNPADTSIVQAYNAGDATVNGFELEVLVMPVDDLTLTFDYAYLDPEFDQVEALAGTTFDPAVNPASPYQLGDNIKDVFALPYAAQDTVNMAVDYTFLRFATSDLTAHLDYHFQSKMFDTATTGPAVPGKEFYQVPSYGLVNARLTWAVELPRGDNAKVSLWGRNILNKEYPVQVIGLGNGIATPGVAAGYTQSAKIWAPPPSYGIELVYEY